MKLLLLATPLLLLGACGDGKADAAHRMADQADSLRQATTAAIDLSDHDLPLLLTPPDAQVTGGAAPTVTFNETAGRTEVKAGDHFALTIYEDPGDMARLKADLDRDLLKKNTILKDTTDLLVYRSEFPDDPSLVFIHFQRVLHAGGRTFVVQDMDGMRFTEQDVQRMQASLSPKTAV